MVQPLAVSCCTLLSRRGRWGLAPTQLLVSYVFTATAHRRKPEPPACAVSPGHEAKRRYVRHCHTESPLQGKIDLLEYSEAAREDCASMVVVPDFVSAKEERSLMQEIGRTLRGKRYLYDHWDGVRVAVASASCHTSGETWGSLTHYSALLPS